MNRESLYFHSPPVLQAAFTSAAGLGVSRRRYSGDYIGVEAEYKARALWSSDSHRAFAQSRRAQSLALASTTPYYGDLFQELGAAWHELVDDDSFQTLPPTPKVALREQPERFAPRAPIPDDAMTRTSGTTGSSVAVLRSRSAVNEQWAVWWRYRGWHGIHRGEPCALFAGRRIMRADQGAPYWRRNVPGNELRFSTYHISPQTAPQYIRRLNTYRPRWIHGFSSAIANLAELMLEQGLRITFPLKWITLGGENVTKFQTETIVEAFGVRPLQHYGLAEGAANFSTCLSGTLHVDEDFAGVEFVPDPSGLSRVLGTTFANHATVLLRYDTGDLASVANDAGCSCGFGGRVVRSLDGRGDETIRLPDGRLVGSPEDAFRKDLGVAQAQLRQHTDGTITVAYVRGMHWTEDTLERVEAALRDFLGNEIVIQYSEVSSIPRTRGGKTRLVVKDVE